MFIQFNYGSAMKLKLILFFLFSFVLQPIVFAGPLEKGINAINEKKYELGYKILLPLAEKNNAEAQFQIGRLFIDELTKNIDPKQGVIWLEKAVVNQHREAAQILSKMYLSGMGVPLDVKKGQYYLEVAEKLKPQEVEDDDCD